MQLHPAVKKYGGVDNLPGGWAHLLHDLPNTIILDTALRSNAFGEFNSIEEFIRDVRRDFPYVVFILFNSDGQSISNSDGSPPNIKTGMPDLRTYYQIKDIRFVEDLTFSPSNLLNCLGAAETSLRLTYDVAISYAGVEIQFADELVTALKSNGVRVYIDAEHPADILGHNLEHFLGNIYGFASRHFVPIISHAYIVNQWTNFEMRTAINTGVANRGKDYIIQVKLNDLPFPDLSPDTAFIPVGRTILQITDLLIQKLWLTDWPGTRENFGHFEFDVFE